MGYYLNKSSADIVLPARGKVTALLRGGATQLRGPVVFQPNLVCVIDNGPFEAAGYAYSETEMKEFLRPDGRPKTWLIVENADVLSGYKES